ncbi:MAG: hypothetical protein GXO79_12505 [Chlorobi bacterium]|nr:hypothetical protein [Chlorobiota bacterium]
MQKDSNEYTSNKENKEITSIKDSNFLGEILVANPPLSLDFYPCSDCHDDLEVNTQRRELVEMHDDIVFNHDSENRWCLACHDANNRDSLRLASGKLLSFKKSYKLCGQCHGPKYRDWKLGIHGKRTGEWNGKKQYLLCVHCHDPHSPRFKPLKPKPKPLTPLQISLDSLK